MVHTQWLNESKERKKNCTRKEIFNAIVVGLMRKITYLVWLCKLSFQNAIIFFTINLTYKLIQ